MLGCGTHEIAPDGGDGGSDATVPGDVQVGDTPVDAGQDAERGGSGFEPGPVDELIAAMPPGSWRALPSTAMRDACPPPYNEHRCKPVQSAWSGAAWDPRSDRMIVYGGGHGDSFYNNIFVFDLRTMSWKRQTEMPEGATSSKATEAMQQVAIESCGVYPKNVIAVQPEELAGDYLKLELCDRPDISAQLDWQQPRSSHTYGKLWFDVASNSLCYPWGNYYPSAQYQGGWGFCYSFDTGRWTRTPNRPDTVRGRGVAAVDAQGNVWYATDDSGAFAKWTPSTMTWETFGRLNYNARGVADIDRQRNVMLHLAKGKDGLAELKRFDLNDIESLRKNPPFQLVSAVGATPAVGMRSGFVYADARDRFIAWSGGQSLAVFDPSTSTWTTLTGTGDDPGAELGAGTYGRFRYSNHRDVFVLVNGVTNDAFVFKPPTTL